LEALMAEQTVSDVLLARKGLVFLPREQEWTQGVAREPVTENHLRAVEVSLADIGYALTTRLRARLAVLPLFELALVREQMIECLAKASGARHKHVPLFRKFPDDIPADTTALWWKKFLARFFQAEHMPCLFCRRTGATYVLKPCVHVVCEHCWDGANYSACPVCERAVDRRSPFFLAAPTDDAPLPNERAIKYKLLDLGQNVQDDTRALFGSLCERQQAMSPVDAHALTTIVAEVGAGVVAWLPPKITVKENSALVFGTLLQKLPPDIVIPIAREYLKTATDVLRMIAVLSGADASLQGVPTYVSVSRAEPGRWATQVEKLMATSWKNHPNTTSVYLQYTKKRFRMARLSRPFRRAVLSIMESFDAERLTEDMLRHRSYWVWVGELLHPHEHAKRFPKVVRAFAIVREHAPDGTPAPKFRTFAAKVEEAIATHDVASAVTLLRTRPGDFARRFDHLLRVAAEPGTTQGQQPPAVALVTRTFESSVKSFSTPVLLTLWTTLPTRTAKAPVRMYWPKGGVSKGVAATDRRAPLPPEVARAATAAVQSELLRRFAEKPAFADFVVDDALAAITVPFNERTASPSAVQLARGSRVASESNSTLVRLFLHWCQPKGGYDTDIDLSVAFYDEDWKYVGVCSYYELECVIDKKTIAKSAGDRQDAPWPDGATEFVDLHRAEARAAGIRYAVMVVNAYAGMTFGQLERGYAGIMMREDEHGTHFDPRTVTLKFALQGENGVFMPLVFDVDDGTIHWLDVYSTGRLMFNNVATSNSDVSRICPTMMKYFATGVRANMRDLALLHAAARGKRVHLRAADGTSRTLVREDGEAASAFFSRLRTEDGSSSAGAVLPRGGGPAFAALYKGDLELPEKSVCYALFREELTNVSAASELIG
jgi:hypothetical protein